MTKMISVFGNSFDDADVEAMKRVMDSHLVGMGDITKQFEQAFAQKIGFQYGIGTNSCTNSFWIILKALGFTQTDHVLIPNIHFFGVRNVLDLLGIQWTPVDTNYPIPNLTVESLQEQIRPETRAIIFLEYGGYPVDIQSIKSYLISIHRQDILLILDAANSPFTQQEGKYTALDYDIVAYSFDMNKIIVTGDGGMILTNNQILAEKLKSLSYYGISDLHKSGFNKSKEVDVWWEIDVAIPSLKLPMNNLTAALGLSQLAKVDAFLAKRTEIVAYYQEHLQTISAIRLPSIIPSTRNNVYLFWVLTQKGERNSLAKTLKQANIYTTVKYQPLVKEANTPKAYQFYESSLCIPLNQNLTIEEVDYIVATIKRFYG